MSGPTYYGIYRGTVVNNIDPMQIGRLQVQVPLRVPLHVARQAILAHDAKVDLALDGQNVEGPLELVEHRAQVNSAWLDPSATRFEPTHVEQL